MNKLRYETSPYLLQHAHNPVDWYAWKPEALERAKREDKPILVSIGYSTCHWCHVMERESFEEEEVAAYMNKHFINIKIDREERPDLDQIYMEACQALTGSGGWPLNCFLTPEGKPFYAGTYYPPQPMPNRPSWLQLLIHIERIYREKKEVVETQATKLSDLIARSGKVFFSEDLELETTRSPIHKALIEELFNKMEGNFDKNNGGFGGAPKFPMTMSLEFLFKYYTQSGTQAALDQVELSLEKMIKGGIYDQLGGGFARYATDSAWLVPHFEKMLYDNALLVSLLSEVYKYTGKKIYLSAIEETLAFVAREMTDEAGAFYSALDADSEGVEGKFYIWSYEEVEALLGAEATLFCAFYNISKEGNWEHSNILWRPYDYAEFAEMHKVEEGYLLNLLKRGKSTLFEDRKRRVRPGLDHKILLSWNALMCTAYVKAYHATGYKEYADTALKNLSFLEAHFRKKDALNAYFHVAVRIKEGFKYQYDAFLEDYAYLIEAMLAVYSISFDIQWIRKAADLSEKLMAQFIDESSDLFYFTSAEQKDIPLRRIDVTDNAIPSGNATLFSNFQQLAILDGRPIWKEQAQKMGLRMLKGISNYPASFAKWGSGLLSMAYPIKEVAIVGEAAFDSALAFQKEALSNYVLMASKEARDNFPLLADKKGLEGTNIFICENYTCKRPVLSIEEAVALF